VDRALMARAADTRPERWAVDAGDAGVATLAVPPDAQRERRFEVACAMTVQPLAGSDGGWHRMTVLVDGSRQWQRQVATHPGEGPDGLDLRFERRVPPGRALRITVEVAAQGARRRSLQIEAEEQRD
jgi:hypothetical protein